MAETPGPLAADRLTVVMIASDDQVVRHRAATGLAPAGFEVVDGGSVAGAIGAVRDQQPDLLILEANSSAALVALWALRADPDTRRTPVITVSRNPTEGWGAECLRLGAADHLRSPFEPLELVARIQAVVRGVAELERLQRRSEILEYLAAFDELTWLANRRHLEDELVRATSAADRHRHSVCLVLVAADGWDGVAKLPAAVPMAVLREIAVLIGSVRRSEDIAARWDDSVFAALLPMTGPPGAAVFADRIRAAVAAAPIPTELGPLPITLSIGWAAYPDHTPDRHDLPTRAAIALAEAQTLGGDRVVSA